jgi:hypothetical protein
MVANPFTSSLTVYPQAYFGEGGEGGRECTDKKENQIFLIYKEIQSGAVAKSYMTNGLLIYREIFTHFKI